VRDVAARDGAVQQLQEQVAAVSRTLPKGCHHIAGSF
jgi:hypothetical protein